MRKTIIAASVVALIAGATAVPALAQGPGGHGGFGGYGGMIMRYDADQDGVVTQSEFNTARAASFSETDANHDGALSRDEIQAFHRAHREARREAGGPRRDPMSRADANNDGRVTREEFLAGPAAMFDRMDTNNDGVLSADERPQRPQRGERPQHQRVDANNDGSISRDEYNAAGAQRFAALDANHDGRVTTEEAQAGRPHGVHGGMHGGGRR